MSMDAKQAFEHWWQHFGSLYCEHVARTAFFAGYDSASPEVQLWLRTLAADALPPSADQQKEKLAGTVNSASPDSTEKKEGAE